jgi:hypothetical protein
MNRFVVFRRWAWSILVVGAMAFALGGCSGDDGKDGADGATGQPGPPGEQGPEGPAGPGASVTPVESCGVCHDQGSFADASAAHALPVIELVQNVAFAVDGADLDVTFDLLADQVLTAGYDTVERGYRTEGTARTDICNAPSRSDPCDPGSLFLTDNTGGSYTLTVVGGAAEAANDNRYLFRVADSTDDDTGVYFYGDFPASPVEDLVVSGESCAACHGQEGIPIHGGYFAAEDGGEPCLTCHGVGTTPRLVQVAHGYHIGVETWTPELTEINVTYPTYMNNCSVCHSEGAELTAANAMPFSGDCFTCHGDMASFTEWFKPDGGPNNNPGELDLSIHFALTPTPETADCSQCHNAVDGIAAGKLVVADAHNGQVTERGGIIIDGEDTSITEGERIDWQITGVVDDGVNLAITWTASYDGTGVDPCNDVVGPNAPVFFAGAEDTVNENTIRIYRSYAQGDDFIMGTGSNPGQPDRDDVDLTNTVCAGNVATTTIPVDTTDNIDKGRLTLAGRPLVENVLDPALTMRVRVPTPTYDWKIGDGAAVARRDVVDTTLCLNCHVGSMYQHGGDRIDNVDKCLVCHNAAANEQYVREGMGVDASEAYDGKVGELFEMKTMLHRIHSANHDWDPARGVEEYNPPYLVYRGRGIYAFAGEGDFPPNWDTSVTEGCTAAEIADGKSRVFGSSDTSTDKCEEHHFHSPTFPRSLNACMACHKETFTVIPDQAKSMASSVEVGADYVDQTDDVLQGAATSACVTCHYNTATRGHAYQNSWEPQEFPEGRQTIIDAGN